LPDEFTGFSLRFSKRIDRNTSETSARVFGSTTDTLDAIPAELTRHVDTQAIIEAMTPKAKEFFFLPAGSIAAHCNSKRLTRLRR
jgi:hypothetical protein